MLVGTLVSLLLLVCAPAQASPPPVPSFTGEAELVTRNGAQLLEWAVSGDEGELEFELAESTSPSFAEAETRYRGTMPSWYLSGRPDGRSYFRVRSRVVGEDGELGPWSAWSTSQALRVEHHDTGLALALFGIGALVFTATALTVFAGARGASRSGEQAR